MLPKEIILYIFSLSKEKFPHYKVLNKFYNSYNFLYDIWDSLLDSGYLVEIDLEKIVWTKNGQKHGIGEFPSVIWDSGTREWYKFGVLFRNNGPKIEWADGEKW